MQVLFEYKGSRRQLSLSPYSVCDVVRDELVKLGLCPAPVKLSSEEVASNEYLLQLWSSKWNAFIDVSNVSEIEDHDKLTVICKPTAGSPQVCHCTKYVRYMSTYKSKKILILCVCK